jgi:hypothetical protein
MYDILHHMSAATSKKKKSGAMTTIIKSEPAKSQSTPDLTHQQSRGDSNSTTSSGDINDLEAPSAPIPSSSSRLEFMRKKRTARNSSSNTGGNDSRHQPKSGALAAAMMAATVAGGGSFFDVNKLNDSDTISNNSSANKRVSRKHNASDPLPPTSHFDRNASTKTIDDESAPKIETSLADQGSMNALNIIRLLTCFSRSTSSYPGSSRSYRLRLQ